MKIKTSTGIEVEGEQEFIFEFAAADAEVQAAGGIDEYIKAMPELEEDDDGPGNEIKEEGK